MGYENNPFSEYIVGPMSWCEQPSIPTWGVIASLSILGVVLVIGIGIAIIGWLVYKKSKGSSSYTQIE